MASAIHFDVPFSVVQDALKSINLEDLDKATRAYDPRSPDARQLQGRLQSQINNLGTLYSAMFETHMQRSRINKSAIDGVDYSPFGFDYYESSPFPRFGSVYNCRAVD